MPDSMTDPILEKLDAEWTRALRSKDDALAGKILRSKINVLKTLGALGEHTESIRAWVKALEDRLPNLSVEVSLTVIGHLRHARKAISLTSSDVGSAFREPISAAERAKYRQRNRPPALGIADRADLPKDYANGSPSVHLRAGQLDHGTA